MLFWAAESLMPNASLLDNLPSAVLGWSSIAVAEFSGTVNNSIPIPTGSDRQALKLRPPTLPSGPTQIDNLEPTFVLSPRKPSPSFERRNPPGTEWNSRPGRKSAWSSFSCFQNYHWSYRTSSGRNRYPIRREARSTPGWAAIRCTRTKMGRGEETPRSDIISTTERRPRRPALEIHISRRYQPCWSPVVGPPPSPSPPTMRTSQQRP